MENENLEEMVVTEADEQLDLAEEAETPETDEEEDVISIEGETPPVQEETQHAPAWVKEVRKRNRELNEEVKKLRAQVERVNEPQTMATLPQKPRLEDFDYIEEDYEKALDKWYKSKDEYDRQEQIKAEQVKAQQKQWEDVVNSYTAAKKSLRVKDYDLAEGIVEDGLSIEQQAVILQGAKDPATVVYALGKNKAKLDELATIKDPIKFAFAIAELQSKLKVERRNAPPPPEKAIKGSASGSGVDSTLESLRKEAERTGDYSKVFSYKQNLKKGN